MWKPKGVLACALLGFGFAVHPATSSCGRYHQDTGLRDEHGGLFELRGIKALQDNYRGEHGEYAVNFRQLRPWLGAELIDNDVVGMYGYRFSMVSERRADGKTISYQVNARPLRFLQGSKRSFFMTDNGIIHFTRQNREATTADPIQKRDPGDVD